MLDIYIPWLRKILKEIVFSRAETSQNLVSSQVSSVTRTNRFPWVVSPAPSVTPRHQLKTPIELDWNHWIHWLMSQYVHLAMEVEKWMSPSSLPLCAMWTWAQGEGDDRLRSCCKKDVPLGLSMQSSEAGVGPQTHELGSALGSNFLCWEGARSWGSEDWVLIPNGSKCPWPPTGSLLPGLQFAYLWNNLITALQRELVSKRWLGLWVQGVGMTWVWQGTVLSRDLSVAIKGSLGLFPGIKLRFKSQVPKEKGIDTKQVF